MTPPLRPFDADALLAQANWLRSLARTLVPTDPHLADDLAQDACLAALEKAPATDRSLHSWLATVVRNLARQNRRGDAHRSEREKRAAKGESQPSTLEHLEVLSVHQSLLVAVRALEEPYREVVVLRFFEELSPAQIARRTGTPIATVKTRLARAIEKLRARLATEYEREPGGWLAALVPLLAPPHPATALTIGTILMSTKLKLALAAVVVASLLVAFWPRPEVAPADETVASTPKVHGSTNSGGATLAAEPAKLERSSVPSSSAPSRASAPVVHEERVPIAGVLLDVHARPLPALEVGFRLGHREVAAREFRLPKQQRDPSLPSTRTGADGRFELAVPPADGELLVEEESWTTVLSSLVRNGNARSEHVVVAAPRLQLSGRVVDPEGHPLASARIEIRSPKGLRTAFPQILDSSAEVGWSAESDAQGHFAFGDAPRIEDATLRVAVPGYRNLEQAAPLANDHALELVLQPIAGQPGIVYGEVLDPHGARVAGARVTLGHSNLSISDERGEFHLELPKSGKRDPWIAIQPGFQPAIESASAAVQRGEADPAELIVLRLGPPPLTIRGKLVDADDKPQAGWRVFLADPTFFGAFDEVPTHVEGVLAGAADRSALEKRMAEAPAGSNPEQMLIDTSSVFWTYATTDAGGEFELTGLLDRNYRLAVLDTHSLLRFESGAIAAGTRDALVRVPGSSYLENLRGRVLSSAGKPVAGVRVRPSVEVLRVHLDENSWSSLGYPATAIVTDAEGRFQFARLPREHASLSLSGEDIVPTEWGEGGIGKAAGESGAEVVIRVELSFHVQVEFANGSADALEALDADGKGVNILVFEGTSSMSSNELPLEGGRSKIFVLSESARTLVLRKANQEVRRVQLSLAPGQLNLLQL